MLAHLRAAAFSTIFFTLLLGLAYPLLITGVGQLAFPDQANGGLIRDGAGRVVGSRLLAQSFKRPEYLHPRPSAAGADGYDASGSSGSNLGPLNPALAERVRKSAEALRAEGGGKPLPADALTTSGSGLDPDISPANAHRQAARVAAARGAPVDAVERIIAAHVTLPALGIFGQPRVNVLETNLALDSAFASTQPPRR